MAREFSVVVGINAARARSGAREFRAGADQVTRSSRQMGRQLRTTNRRVTALITTIGRFRGVATLAFSGFLGVGGLSAVTRTISQFQTEMSRVNALLGPRGTTGVMNALTERARELGASTIFTATQAAEGMRFLTLAGFEAEESYIAVEAALNLAAAGMLDLGNAADIVSNVMSAFNIEAEQTSAVADALAFTASRSNTNIQQLGEAMKFVGPVAGTLGVAVEDTAVALGILGNSGLQASLAGTSLRRVMSGLLNPSKEAKEIFSQLGVTQEELVTTLQGENGIVNLVDRLAEAGLGAAEAFTLFGQRGAPGLLSLINQREELRRLTDGLKDAEGTAAEMARVLQDNLGGDARIAISALQEAILRLADSGLSDFLRSSVQGFTGFIRGISGVETATEDLTESMESGIRVGKLLRENFAFIRAAAIALAIFLSRKLISAIVTTGVELGAAALKASVFGRSLIATRNGAIAAAAGMRTLRSAIISTGVGALLVGIGFLVDWALSADEASEANEDFAATMKSLQSEGEELALVFGTLTSANQQYQLSLQQGRIEEARAKARQLTETLQEQDVALVRIAELQRNYNEALEAQRSIDTGPTGFSNIQASTEATGRALIATEELREAEALLALDRQKLLADQAEALKLLDEQIQLEADLQAVYRGEAKSVRELRESRERLNQANAQANITSEQLTGLTLEQIDAIKELVDQYDKVAGNVMNLEQELELVNKALALNSEQMTIAGFSSERLARTQRELEFQIRKAKLEMTGAEQAAQDWTEKLEDLRDAGDKVAQLERELARDAQELIREWIIAGAGAGELTEALKLLREEFERNKKELEEQCEETEEFEGCQSEVAKNIERIWDQAMRNVQDAFADAFRGAFDSFDDFADRLIDAFKDMIANMLAAWFTSGIQDIFKGVFNPTGGAGGGGIFSGGFGGLKDIFSKGVKGLTDAGKKFLGALANFGKGFGGFFGIGSGGTGVGGALGGAAAAGVTGLASGTVVDSILGGRGDPGTTNLLSGAGGIIGGLVGGPIGALIGGAIGSFASNLFGGAKKLESATAQFVATQDGFIGNLEKVVSKQRSFFRGRKFKTTTESLDTSSFSEALDGVLGAIGQIGESLGVDANEALSGFRFERDVNVKGKSEEEIAQLLTDTFNDAVLAAIREFINNAEGLSDRLTRTVRLFQGNSEEFIAAFEAAAAIDLALAVNPVEQATKAIEDANKTLGTSYRELLESYRVLVSEYDGSLDSLQTLSQATVLLKEAQLALATALVEAGTRISDTFQNSAQTIREALLNEEELFNLRKSQIDELVVQAQNTTDPQELQRLAEEINRLGLDAFNILDESQQQALGSEFIEFFEELDTLFGDQVQLGLDNLSDESSAIDQEVADSMTAAAQSIVDANNAARDLWDEWRDWIRRDRASGGSRFNELVP